MAANLQTGRSRSVRYCGTEYCVRPGETYGNKQAWIVFAGEEQISVFTPTRSKAVKRVHEHAVETGSFPGRLDDGLNYDQLVSSLCR